jgi:hypothetical protein
LPKRDTFVVSDKPDAPKLRWPEDEPGKTEQDDARADKPVLDQVPMSTLEGETILGGHFVERVRRWRQRHRRKR